MLRNSPEESRGDVSLCPFRGHVCVESGRVHVLAWVALFQDLSKQQVLLCLHTQKHYTGFESACSCHIKR